MLLPLICCCYLPHIYRYCPIYLFHSFVVLHLLWVVIGTLEVGGWVLHYDPSHSSDPSPHLLCIWPGRSHLSLRTVVVGGWWYFTLPPHLTHCPFVPRSSEQEHHLLLFPGDLYSDPSFLYLLSPLWVWCLVVGIHISPVTVFPHTFALFYIPHICYL